MAKVLVTCARSPAAIHLGRLLYEAGHVVILADTKRLHLGRWRSWASSCLRHPSPRHQPQAFTRWLRDTVKNEGIDCVVPVYEETFHHGLNHGMLGCDHFCSDIATLNRLHNKFEFIELANSIGIATPKTILVESIAQVKEHITPGHILKPVYSRFGEQVIMEPNRDKLNIQVSPSDPWILQERLAGKQYCLQGICRDGKVLSSVAYSSEFTVSKSSVFFENTGKGDLGGIIEKVASSCDYTGFLSFDVILCEDGVVRPIECNPRATSAMHLYSTDDRIDDALFNGRSIECTGSARRLVLPMWMNLVSNIFTKGHFKRWRAARKRSTSVEWNVFDPRPAVLQLISVMGFAVVALKNRISLISATTHEFEWTATECRVNPFYEGRSTINRVSGLSTEISGFACYLPPNIKTSEDTVPMGTLPRGIDFKRLTRIESHHEVLEGQGSLELALEASKQAIERSGVPKEEIDLIISCSVTKMSFEFENLIEPCLASHIGARLGLNAQTFDVANACLGMVTGLMIADRRIKAGKIRHALVVSGEYLTGALYEALSKNLLFNPKSFASLTIGDAGAAYVISSCDEERTQFFEPITLAQHSQLCIGDAAIGRPGPAMRTAGKKLQTAALENLGAYFERGLSGKEEWDAHHHIISHQTTPRAVEKGAMVAAKTWGQADAVRSISTTGNTASTSHAAVLESLLDGGELASNQRVYLMAFGSGLSFMGVSFYLPEGVEEW